MFKMRQLLLQKKQKELSEYKAFGMIQDHLFLLYQAIDNIQEITKVLIRLFTPSSGCTHKKINHTFLAWFILEVPITLKC